MRTFVQLVAFAILGGASCYADTFQTVYAVNVDKGESFINATNTAVHGTWPIGFGSPNGNICLNVYGFSPDEQLVSCCSCLITPNGLVSLSVTNDVLINTLTGIRPNSAVIKLVTTASAPGASFTTNCTNSAALAGTPNNVVVGGSQAWGTTLHGPAVNGGSFVTTEVPALEATLNPQDLLSITSRCANIIGNGSSYGLCRSCRNGGQSVER